MTALEMLYLQLVVAEKTQNLRRLEAQRNELNAKGDWELWYTLLISPV